MIQIYGMAAMSVVKYVVTPSIRLVGTAANPIQRKRRSQVTSLLRARLTSFLGGGVWLLGEEAEARLRCLPKRLEAVMAVAGWAVGFAGAAVPSAGTRT